jgi:hypothetical protein
LVDSDETSSWRFGADIYGGRVYSAKGELFGDRVPFETRNGGALGLGLYLAREPFRLGMMLTFDGAALDLPEPFTGLGVSGHSYGLWFGWEHYGLGIWDRLLASPIVGVNRASVSILDDSGGFDREIVTSETTFEYVAGLSLGVFARPAYGWPKRSFISFSVCYLYRYAKFDDFSVYDASVASGPFADPSNMNLDLSGHMLFVVVSIAGYGKSLFK